MNEPKLMTTVEQLAAFDARYAGQFNSIEIESVIHDAHLAHTLLVENERLRKSLGDLIRAAKMCGLPIGLDRAVAALMKEPQCPTT